MLKDLLRKLTEKDKGSYKDLKLTERLDVNIKIINDIFKDDDTLVVRRFENGHHKAAKFCMFFFNGMVDDNLLNENIVKPLLLDITAKSLSGRSLLKELETKIIHADDVQESGSVEQMVDAMMSGNTLLLVEGFAEALIIQTKGYQTRSITEPSSERVIRGPREGFTEDLMVNLTMIRRKVKSPELKFKFMEIGTRTHTKVCICYIEGLVNEKILQEFYHRLDNIDIDGVMDSGYIQELIKDAPFSPFETLGHSERPDVTAGKMLEGRIALIVDGSPEVLTAPFVFIENFQSDEDYYSNFFFGSINRIVRILSGAITISMPAIYVAIATYHHEMIPTPLLISISAAREGIPFPTIIEVILMLAVFEILREAGVKLPAAVGDAVNIVGALVLGQAVIQARFVSAPVVIIVAITGITSLMIYQLKGPIIISRIVFLILASILGIFGIAFGVLALVIHLSSIRSFGIPYMLTIGSIKNQDLKDTAIRVPWWYMHLRPPLIGARNLVKKPYEKPGGKRT